MTLPKGLYRKTGPPKDYFGRVVEVGDFFFCGNPSVFGRVIKILGKSIEIETGADRRGANSTMRFKSPDQGIITSKLDGTENPG